MKNYIYMKNYILCMLLVFLSVQSCEDYLTEENPNNVPVDQFYKDLTETNANLTSTYGAMLNEYVYSFDVEAWRSDLGFPKSRRAPFGPGLLYYEKGNDPNDNDIVNRWDALYLVIFRANQTIQGLNGLEDSFKANDEWTEQMGQARLLRGLSHFYLHSTFNEGNVIIRDTVPVLPEDFSIPASFADEVQDFFREDLKYAYDNLPAKFSDKSRVDRGFAATLLGKSYLYSASENNSAEDYKIARDYFIDVTTNAEYDYKLLEGEDVKLLHTSDGAFSTESIFEINYALNQQIEEENNDQESFFNRWARFSAPTTPAYSGQAYFIPSAWLAYDYSNEPMDTQDIRNYVTDLVNGGVKLRSVPLRCAQMIQVSNDDESTFYGDKPGNDRQNFGGTIFSFFKHFINYDITNNEANILGTAWKSGKNVVVNRLSEVYLMLAECQANLGEYPDAIKNINKIRQRWGLVSLGASDGSTHDFDEETYDNLSDIMNHLMYKEYPLEISIEGYSNRTIDLRRWKIAKMRFDDLGTRNYHLIANVPSNGEGKSKANSLVQEGVSPAPSNQNTLTEYREAASNYNQSTHDYLPVPNAEELNNLKFYERVGKE